MRIAPAFALLTAACWGVVAKPADWQSEHRFATLAYEKGDYAGAEQHARTALVLAESFGENDSRLEGTLTQLGVILQARGNCCDAEPFLTRALAIREKQYGKDSIETALGQNNLAAVWEERGRTEDARKLQSEALATAEKFLAPNSPDLVPYLTHAAVIERDAARYGPAEELLKRARLLAENDTSDPRRLIETWKYLGYVYRSAGRFDEAQQAYKKLVELCQQKLGPDALDTANALASLGSVLCQRRFYSEARPYLSQAVDTFRRIKETGLPSFAATLQNLSGAELYLGEANQAEQDALLALKVLEHQSKADRGAIAVAANNLGQVYSQMGRYREAEQATSRAKDIWIEIGGSENKNVAAAISNLGALNVQQHKYKKAEELYREASQIDSKLSTANVDYARDLNRLGVVYNDEKRFPKSEEVLRQAVDIDSEKLGANSPILAEAYLNLAFSLEGQHRLDEALECFQRGVGIMTDAGQRNTPGMANVLEQYSGLLREMHRFADAEQASTDALGIRVKEKVKGETYR